MFPMETLPKKKYQKLPLSSIFGRKKRILDVSTSNIHIMYPKFLKALFCILQVLADVDLAKNLKKFSARSLNFLRHYLKTYDPTHFFHHLYTL